MRKGGATLAVVLGTMLNACGGGGGASDSSFLFPLWVPTDIAVSDVDADGRADIVTLAEFSTSMSHSEGRLTVHLQQAGGGFAAAQSYVVETYPWHFAIADLDGDGAVDVVVGDPDDAQAVTWLRQDPATRGRFLAPVRLLTGLHAYDVAVADLNGDGALDVVATDSLSSRQRVVMLPQDLAAAGTFGPAFDVALPGSSVAVAAADLDSDGLADLALGYTTAVTALDHDSSLATLSQQAGAGFATAQTLVTRRGLNVDRLHVADYDGDGTLDLVAFLAASGTGSTSEVLALIRPGVGAPISIETSLAGVQGTDDAAFGDFDGDGRMDAALAGFFPVGSPSRVESRLNLFRQSANGSLQAVGTRSLPIDVSRIAAGDVDGDGHLDLVLLGGDNQALLMLQTPAGTGDFLAPQSLP